MHGQQRTAPTPAGYRALTDKEKQTLRLLLDGHDAKSMARHLDLSVHTINERLRDARRKLSVSSSREAARLLRQHEGTAPQMLGDRSLGDAPPPEPDEPDATPEPAAPTRGRRHRAIGGSIIMLALALAAALAVLAPDRPLPAGPQATTPTESTVTNTARDWLALVDAGRWADSYAGTTATFRTQNTVEAWRAASEKVRVPLGPVQSRTLLDEQDTPAPPNGYRTVRFRTDFARKRGVIETLSLEQDGKAWRIAGIYIE
jgi:DNA-binding CsgD family transcriptional regulator